MQHSFTASADPSLAASAEFRIGLRSLPLLADHGFQDMVVLPGSFYIEMALSVHRDLFGPLPGTVRNVAFHNLVILSEEDAVIRVDVRCTAGGPIEYVFSEAPREGGSAGVRAEQFAARLEIDREPQPLQRVDGDASSIETFQAHSQLAIDSQHFYRQLREGGNQYGPAFQHVLSVSRAGEQVLGTLSVPRGHDTFEPDVSRPIFLDAATQLLAAFNIEKRQTFILRSIESIEIAGVNPPATLWGHATWLATGETDEHGFVGNVRVFDQAGQQYLELRGVAFTFLNRVAVADDTTTLNLCIAANFTAEPLEDSLTFWGNHFGVPTHVEFASYNQVFQQLLDSASAFRKNRDGVNIILIRLEEWMGDDRLTLLALPEERRRHCFGNRPTYLLPNGLPIVHLNQYETDYVYKEIFVDECYSKHGIRLDDHATVIDIGANIGLFSLFVMSRCAAPTIFAFEPSPVAYPLLKANCEAYGTNVRTFNFGVSDTAKTGTFTSYDHSSVFSGFHPNLNDDRDAIQAVVRNMLKRDMAVENDSIAGYVDELTATRLRHTAYECSLTCVSDIIRDNQIERIDLLKIDAEKSELDIVLGIRDGDWPKIAQIVIEVHDQSQLAVKRLEGILTEKGFTCAVEQESLLEHSGFVQLYATRPGTSRDGVLCPAGSRTRKTAANLQRNIGELCAAMRSFTNQTTVPVLLALCPASPATEADAELKAALDDAEQALLSEASAIANVHTIRSVSPLEHYSITDYDNPESYRLAHIPYTTEYHVALGTSLFRLIFNLRRPPVKVIVLDCDHTLWSGVCGEDGPLGIQVTAPYRALQEFMIEQVHAGRLLCLCSKNNEADVVAVFEQRLDMPLTLEHVVSRRINWNRKSANIESLATELAVGMDSFIFIDDNPVECADVRLNCPGVVTLQMPRDVESVPSFLKHIWVLDHTRVTAEDRNRTRMYRENTERQKLRDHTVSLAAFIEGLHLRVSIDEPTMEDLDRVSQLTFRTNQFNFTTIRRSAAELTAFLRRPNTRCLVVRASDRFGDYGLCGVVLYEAVAGHYEVDTFLLSCRVLGRGVEHALLAALGRRAVSEGSTRVTLSYLPTAKNLPALEFLKGVVDLCPDRALQSPLKGTSSVPMAGSEGARSDDAGSWTFAAEGLATLAFDPDSAAQPRHEVQAARTPGTRPPALAPAFGAAAFSEQMQRVAETLRDIEPITEAIARHRMGKHAPPPPAAPALGGTLEAALATIWSKALGRAHIGLHDNFFEAGGTSLRTVQVIAMIKKELKRDLSIVSLFECPTVALLAAKLRATPGADHDSATIVTATLRGQQRRRNTILRKTS